MQKFLVLIPFRLVIITLSLSVTYSFSLKQVRNSHPREDVNKRCVHFYACICAFASDEKLAEEFSHYINMDQSLAAG